MDTNYAAPQRPPQAPRPRGFVTRVLRSARGTARLSFVVVVLVQVYVLYLDVSAAPGGLDIPHLDKVVHGLIFAAPAFFAVLGRLPLWPVLTALAVHAPVSEAVQHLFIGGRAGELLDVVADWVGILVGAAIGLGLLRARRSL